MVLLLGCAGQQRDNLAPGRILIEEPLPALSTVYRTDIECQFGVFSFRRREGFPVTIYRNERPLPLEKADLVNELTKAALFLRIGGSCDEANKAVVADLWSIRTVNGRPVYSSMRIIADKRSALVPFSRLDAEEIFWKIKRK